MLEAALKHLDALGANPYPGRGLVVGMDESGENLIQVYWIMGRSENSRNRVFTSDPDGTVSTEPADPSKVKDPSLIIYNAMREHAGVYVVSNGDQTDTVMDWVLREETRAFPNALAGREYEPDKPNYTPRITAVSYRRTVVFAEIALLAKSAWSWSCNRHFFFYDRMAPGIGFCVTTYKGDGDPLPAFEGEPYPVPLQGDLKDIASDFWEALNPENRVSLAVKRIPVGQGPSEVLIKNKYEKVELV